MKLFIDKNFIVKKMKISEIFGKYMLYTTKKSLEHVEFRFRMKKYDVLKKNTNFEIFPILIQRGDPLVLKQKIHFF